jgi:hypothetical protein
MEIRSLDAKLADPRGRPPGALPRPLACTPAPRSRRFAYPVPPSAAPHCRPRAAAATIVPRGCRDGPPEPGDDG